MQQHELERSRYMRGRSIVRLGAASGAGLLLCGLLTAAPALNVLPTAAGSSPLVAGTPVAWGLNSSGQLGDASTTNSDVPVGVAALTSMTSVSAGGSFSVATRSDGSVWAWGANGDGQLGNDTTTQSTSAIQVVGVGDSGDLSAISTVAA